MTIVAVQEKPFNLQALVRLAVSMCKLLVMYDLEL